MADRSAKFLGQIPYRGNDGPRVGPVLTFALFISLVLHQFGPSYHLSFGVVGLGILLYIFRRRLNKTSALMALAAASAILLSYAVFALKYGSGDNFARILRYVLNAALLLLLLSPHARVPGPKPSVLWATTGALVLLSAYQAIADPYFKPPIHYYALSSGEQDFREALFPGERRRAFGLYQEPSVLGMVLCCLYALATGLRRNHRPVFFVLIALGVLFSKSLLGLIGLMCLGALSVWRREVSIPVAALGVVVMVLAVILMGEPVGLLASRSYSTGSALDDSSLVRLVYPFRLIAENVRNFDFFGYPGDTFEHFMYTGLYGSRGDYPGHNGLLSVLIELGLGGALCLWLIFSRVSDARERFLIVLIASQSGNFFSYEKVFLMTYVILALRGVTLERLRAID